MGLFLTDARGIEIKTVRFRKENYIFLLALKIYFHLRLSSVTVVLFPGIRLACVFFLNVEARFVRNTAFAGRANRRGNQMYGYVKDHEVCLFDDRIADATTVDKTVKR